MRIAFVMHVQGYGDSRMNVTAYYILHYGAEWLNWSMKSILSLVDNVRIFYTPTPSHGHTTDLQLPIGEDKDILQSIVSSWSMFGSRITWYDCGPFRHEGEHRELAAKICFENNADIVVVVDADELWDYNVLLNAIAYAKDSKARTFRIGMRHFWRSLWWVCDDPAMPTRIIKRQGDGEEYIGDSVGKVFHMGYAQRPLIIRYKQSIHGHKNDWRPNWFTDKFLNWEPGMGDVHPTNVNFWTPKPYTDPDNKMMTLAGDHPYYRMGIIR